MIGLLKLVATISVEEIDLFVETFEFDDIRIVGGGEDKAIEIEEERLQIEHVHGQILLVAGTGDEVIHYY